MSDAVKDRLRIAFFVGIVLVIFIGLGFLSDVRTTQLSAEDGICDLTQADFSGGAFAISGGWRHYPEALRLPESMREDAGQIGASGASYGSYYLRVDVPDDERYVLNLVSIDYATRVYVNGRLVDDIGVVDKDRASAEPRTDRPYYDVYPVNGQIEVALQYANHWHVRGGDSTVLTIGTPRVMAERQARRVGYTAVLMGYLLTAAVLFIGFYVTQPTVPGHLYFAAMCLLIMVRQGLTGDQLFRAVFPNAPWRALFTLEYVDMCLLAIAVERYLHALFPSVMQKPARLAVYISTAVYLLMVLCLDTRIYTSILPWYFALIAAAIIYATVRLLMRMGQLQIEQSLSVIGMGMFCAATLLEMVEYRFFPIWLRLSFPVMPTAMVMFVLTQGNTMFIVLRRRIHEAHMRVAVAEARYEEAISARAEKPQVVLSDFGLTRRESEVAYLLIDGKSRAEISGVLGISLGTVNTYCSRIYQKLGVAGRDDLIRLLLTKN